MSALYTMPAGDWIGERLDVVCAPLEAARPNRRPPPLLIAVNHIDEWRPPHQDATL